MPLLCRRGGVLREGIFSCCLRLAEGPRGRFARSWAVKRRPVLENAVGWPCCDGGVCRAPEAGGVSKPPRKPLCEEGLSLRGVEFLAGAGDDKTLEIFPNVP